MKTLIAIFLLLSIISCSEGIKKEEFIFKNQSKPSASRTKEVAQTFVRTTHIKYKILDKIVSINKQNVSLIDAINLVAPEVNIITLDNNVKLTKKISVRASKQRFDDYLRQLSGLSKYHISTDGENVTIASKLSISWDVSTLSMPNVSSLITQASGQNNAKTIKQNNDAPKTTSTQGSNNWATLINQLKLLLGKEATIISNQRIGSIHATATADKITLADKWLQDIITGSQKQVHFKVSIIETSTSNEENSGNDFSLLSKGNLGDFGISFGGSDIKLNSSDSDGGIASIGSLLKTPLIFGDISFELLIKTLSKRGQVKIANIPNIVLTNGSTAQLSTGSEFDYISSIKSTTDSSGNVTTTAEVSTKNIGLDLKLTAKISKDNKLITVNILPTISSIKSTSNVTLGSSEVTLLDVALTKLATQVIVKPNQLILIGGIYADSIQQAGSNSNNGLLNFLFSNSKTSKSKKEILILLTPTLIKS